MKDRYKEVDERFDKEFTCVVTYEKWPDEEEQRLREPQYKFKDFPNTNPKIIKNFLHSELEKVRQETIEECIEIVKGLCPITFTVNGQHGAQEQEVLYRMQKHNAEIQDALSINKK